MLRFHALSSAFWVGIALLLCIPWWVRASRRYSEGHAIIDLLYVSKEAVLFRAASTGGEDITCLDNPLTKKCVWSRKGFPVQTVWRSGQSKLLLVSDQKLYELSIASGRLSMLYDFDKLEWELSEEKLKAKADEYRNRLKATPEESEERERIRDQWRKWEILSVLGSKYSFFFYGNRYVAVRSEVGSMTGGGNVVLYEWLTLDYRDKKVVSRGRGYIHGACAKGAFLVSDDESRVFLIEGEKVTDYTQKLPLTSPRFTSKPNSADADNRYLGFLVSGKETKFSRACAVFDAQNDSFSVVKVDKDEFCTWTIVGSLVVRTMSKRDGQEWQLYNQNGKLLGSYTTPRKEGHCRSKVVGLTAKGHLVIEQTIKSVEIAELNYCTPILYVLSIPEMKLVKTFELKGLVTYGDHSVLIPETNIYCQTLGAVPYIPKMKEAVRLHRFVCRGYDIYSEKEVYSDVRSTVIKRQR